MATPKFSRALVDIKLGLNYIAGKLACELNISYLISKYLFGRSYGNKFDKT